MKLSQSRTFLPESYYNALHGRFEGVTRDVRRDNNQAREKIGVITDHERQARMQARYDEERRTILHVQSQEWYQKAQDSEEIIRQLQSNLQILGSDIQHLELNISIANSALAWAQKKLQQLKIQKRNLSWYEFGEKSKINKSILDQWMAVQKLKKNVERQVQQLTEYKQERGRIEAELRTEEERKQESEKRHEETRRAALFHSISSRNKMQQAENLWQQAEGVASDQSQKNMDAIQAIWEQNFYEEIASEIATDHHGDTANRIAERVRELERGGIDEETALEQAIREEAVARRDNARKEQEGILEIDQSIQQAAKTRGDLQAWSLKLWNYDGASGNNAIHIATWSQGQRRDDATPEFQGSSEVGKWIESSHPMNNNAEIMSSSIDKDWWWSSNGSDQWQSEDGSYNTWQDQQWGNMQPSIPPVLSTDQHIPEPSQQIISEVQGTLNASQNGNEIRDKSSVTSKNSPKSPPKETTVKERVQATKEAQQAKENMQSVQQQFNEFFTRKNIEIAKFKNMLHEDGQEAFNVFLTQNYSPENFDAVIRAIAVQAGIDMFMYYAKTPDKKPFPEILDLIEERIWSQQDSNEGLGDGTFDMNAFRLAAQDIWVSGNKELVDRELRSLIAQGKLMNENDGGFLGGNLTSEEITQSPILMAIGGNAWLEELRQMNQVAQKAKEQNDSASRVLGTTKTQKGYNISREEMPRYGFAANLAKQQEQEKGDRARLFRNIDKVVAKMSMDSGVHPRSHSIRVGNGFRPIISSSPQSRTDAYTALKNGEAIPLPIPQQNIVGLEWKSDMFVYFKDVSSEILTVSVNGREFDVPEDIVKTWGTEAYILLLRDMITNPVLGRILQVENEDGIKYFMQNFRSKYPTEKITDSKNKFLASMYDKMGEISGIQELQVSFVGDDVRKLENRLKSDSIFFQSIRGRLFHAWVITQAGFITRKSMESAEQRYQEWKSRQ